ncbi:hypothetical protein HU200_028716 [Digitaria exilis]|uniref:NB-ARC domain-containing protein n=1 Tax=Digitaria exilis TaxID=1010633 RepID=A0A835ESR8_9POAL|nr:hypothetical protein HU200_028716 [Digitaria exilis]
MELHGVLTSTTSHRVAVWGPPGVGKTSLVKAEYNIVPGVEEFNRIGFAHKFWVDVPDPLVDVMGVSRDIVSGMTKDGLNSRPDCDDINACRCLLKYSVGRTLLVLDGVRSKHDWDRINADITCAMQPESCVVLITDDQSVAAHCAGRSKDDHVLKVDRLDSDAALELFLQKANINDGSSMLRQVKSLSSKCGGHSKFIVTIASYLAGIIGGQAEIKTEISLLNDNFIHQLHNIPEFDCLKHVLAWLHSKFDDSPTLVKKCVFYLSLFPRDQGGDGRRKRKPSFHCEMSILEGRCSPATSRVGQHLAIGSDWVRDEAAYISLDLSRLRSLTASGKWDPFFISQKMKVLRVLDLEGTTNLEDGDLDQIGELMPRLKFLSLRDCKPISCLPDSLGDLMLLETLDIRHTVITQLPKKITKLQKLQQIRAGFTEWDYVLHDHERQPRQQSRRSALMSSCLSKSTGASVADFRTGGVGLPRGMGSMKALHTLGVVDLDMLSGKALLGELRKKRVKSPFWKLSLSCLDWHHQVLHLPTNLVELSLKVEGMLYQDAVDAVKDHWKVRSLHLHAKEVQDGTVRFFGAGSFSKLKSLKISCRSSYHVMFSQQAMQNLELLKVHCFCLKHNTTPPSEISGLDQLPALKKVVLIGTLEDDTAEEALEEQIYKHPNFIYGLRMVQQEH